MAGFLARSTFIDCLPILIKEQWQKNCRH